MRPLHAHSCSALQRARRCAMPSQKCRQERLRLTRDDIRVNRGEQTLVDRIRPHAGHQQVAGLRDLQLQVLVDNLQGGWQDSVLHQTLSCLVQTGELVGYTEPHRGRGCSSQLAGELRQVEWHVGPAPVAPAPCHAAL